MSVVDTGSDIATDKLEARLTGGIILSTLPPIRARWQPVWQVARWGKHYLRTNLNSPVVDDKPKLNGPIVVPVSKFSTQKPKPGEYQCNGRK